MIVVCISRLQRSHRSLAFLPRALPWAFAFRAFGAPDLSFQLLVQIPHASPKEDWTCMRPVDLHVTSRAVVVLRVQIMLRTSRLKGSDVMRNAVARQTELRDGAEPQQPRMG